MPKTALSTEDKAIVDSNTTISALNVLGQEDAELTFRAAFRVRDALNDLPYGPANEKKLYNLMAKYLRWTAQHFEDKAAAIP